jgi:phosphate transport system substrate-binding protein
MFGKLTKTGLVLLLLCSVVFMNTKAKAQVVPDLKVSGSTTIQPLAEDLGEIYKKKYGKEIQTEGGGSGTGLNNVINGTSDIGNVSRALKDEEKAQLKFTTIANDALVIVVSQDNPMTNITKQQVIDLYTGKTANWKDLGWKNADVVPLLETKESNGTREVFEKFFGVKAADSKTPGVNGTETAKAHKADAVYDLISYISEVPNAVGYSSLGTALFIKEQGAPIKILSYEGVAATKENAIAKTYPITRELNVVYKEQTPKIKNYVDLYFTPEGKAIIQKEGFIPVK